MNAQTLLLSFLFVAIFSSCEQKQGKARQSAFIREEGSAFGTTYHLTYRSDVSYEKEVMQCLRHYDRSLSPFNENSIVSRINRNEKGVVVDTFFIDVYNKAREMYNWSGGLFDITVEPLSRLWKFSNADHADTISMQKYNEILAQVDSIKAFVGMDKTNLVYDIASKGMIFEKTDPRIKLNPNALAEGFGIDQVATLFESKGIKDYMVEIGGEMRVRGLNPDGALWRVGIDSPDEDANPYDRKFDKIIHVTDCSVSTSGTYRQYYYREDRKRLHHIIDPRTGQPVSTQIVSVTVVGPNTMTTDALATSFLCMDYSEAIQRANELPDVSIYVIYESEDGTRHRIWSLGFEKLF